MVFEQPLIQKTMRDQIFYSSQEDIRIVELGSPDEISSLREIMDKIITRWCVSTDVFTDEAFGKNHISANQNRNWQIYGF